MSNKNKQAVKRMVVALASAFAINSAYGFNSDEHKLIVDGAMSHLKIPATVVFPSEVALLANNTSDYLARLKAAKRLAVGFDSNSAEDYDPNQPQVQDNCYWYGYGQRDYNQYIRIPAVSELPEQALAIATMTGNTATPFTIGELASLYGDYRRTSHCDENNNCYLTNGAIDHIEFKLGNAGDYYCPEPVASSDYLKAVGSGVVPPFGAAGNLITNTAGDHDFQDAAWWGDEMLRVANVNDWHFANAGVAWYIGMHRQALYYVNKARTEPKYWIKALHHEANALHTLTDLFAFGHVVTNRGKSSYNIVKEAGLANSTTYSWMEAILQQGGAVRSTEGIVSLSVDALPAIWQPTSSRNEFIASYRGNWAVWALAERTYHDEFNDSGAMVRNLNGERFQLLGDGKHTELDENSKQVIVEATAASVQSLLDAYVALESGQTLEQVGASGSALFTALKHIPVFIESDANNYFTGSWTRFASAVNTVTGAHKVLSDSATCQIPYLSGEDFTWPSKRSTACTTF